MNAGPTTVVAITEYSLLENAGKEVAFSLPLSPLCFPPPLAITVPDPCMDTAQCSLVSMSPLTGRKHQLRVHCSAVLHAPILGDTKYGKGMPEALQVSFKLFPLERRRRMKKETGIPNSPTAPAGPLRGELLLCGRAALPARASHPPPVPQRARRVPDRRGPVAPPHAPGVQLVLL